MQRKNSIELRRVHEEDTDFLWHLANDPEVRAASFSTATIPWEDHLKWLKTRLNDPSCAFFIAFNEENIPIGQVRYDITSKEAIISISVKKEYRGNNYGIVLIKTSVQKIFNCGILKIHAYVKPDNRKSISTFLRANFKDFGLTTIKGHEAIHLVLERER